MQDYQEFLDFAGELADAVPPIALKYFKKDVQAEYKADRTPVTIADKEIESELRKRISARYPGHDIMGEEFENLENASDYCWVLDPIDGTKAFIAGLETFTTLIGLLHKNVPVLGVVDQPVTKERWGAIAPAPANKACHPALVAGSGGLPLAIQEKSELFSDPAIRRDDTLDKILSGIRAVTTSADYFSAAQKTGVESLVAQGVDISHGGDAYAYMMLADGRLDAVFDVSLKPFDILPLLPILQSKGLCIQFFDYGKISDIPTGNVVVARSEKIAKMILEKLL